jgi:hypothetical protein
MNDWKLPDFTKRRILATMNLLEGVSPSHVMRRIEGKMRRYLREWDRHESRYVYPTVKEIHGKDYLIPDRRHHRSKGKPKRDAMRSFVDSLRVIYQDATGDAIGRINTQVGAKEELTEEMRNKLAMVPDAKLRKKMEHKMRHIPDAEQKSPPKHEWKRIPFLAACVKAVGGKYPSGLIQTRKKH